MATVSSTLLYFLGCLLWLQVQHISGDDNGKPINFPSTIPVKIGKFRNWAHELQVPNLWIATPANENDVLTLANWASANNYKIRASGYMHNWSPLTVTSENNKDNVVLVDTTANLKNMQPPKLISNSTYAVTVQSGASMLHFLTFLESYGLGLYATPAPGDITIGGVLAIGGHGTGVPASGEIIPPGHALGTISNLVISFKAVVWDTTSSTFVLKTFQRSDTEAKAFLVSFGRTFITEVTLMVGLNYNLRCESSATITSDELFSPNAGPKTFTSFLDQSGRIETITFPFTKRPWLKVWTITPEKPLLSVNVTNPFNFLFADDVSDIVAEIVGRIAKGNGSLASDLGEIELAAVEAGLLATLTYDIWGSSKNLLLYVKPSTLKVTANGYAIITARANVQKAISAFNSFYNNLIDSYKAEGKHPLNGPVEIRATSLDVVTNGESPSLSAIHPIAGHPEYDTAIWINVLTTPNSPGLYEAMTVLENFFLNEYDGGYAHVRPEWSKGWAFTNESAWSNEAVTRYFVPATFLTFNDSQWNWSVDTLNKYDPKRVFTNSFLDSFLKTV